MEWPLTPEWPHSPSGSGWWRDVLVTSLGLKIPLMPWAWKPAVMGIGVFYAASAPDFLSLASLAASFGAVFGLGAASAWVMFRSRVAAFDALKRKEQVEAEVAHQRLIADAEAAAEAVKSDATRAGIELVEKAKREARRLAAETEAEAFRIREEAEKGSTLILLRDAEEKIAQNRASIDELVAKLDASERRNDALDREVLEIALSVVRAHGHMPGGPS